MENLATPPVPPIFANERETNRFIRVSAIVHAILLAAFVGYNYIAPPTLSTFTPTLRVDLVGLPDALKNDVKLPYEEENPLDPYSEDEDLVNDWDRLESELDYEDSPITARNLT
jgi:hypothetical protein